MADTLRAQTNLERREAAPKDCPVPDVPDFFQYQRPMLRTVRLDEINGRLCARVARVVLRLRPRQRIQLQL